MRRLDFTRVRSRPKPSCRLRQRRPWTPRLQSKRAFRTIPSKRNSRALAKTRMRPKSEPLKRRPATGRPPPPAPKLRSPRRPPAQQLQPLPQQRRLRSSKTRHPPRRPPANRVRATKSCEDAKPPASCGVAVAMLGADGVGAFAILVAVQTGSMSRKAGPRTTIRQQSDRSRRPQWPPTPTPPPTAPTPPLK